MATWVLYDKFRQKQVAGGTGSLDLQSTTQPLKVAWVTAAYTPNQNADEFWSTPQASEVSGTNYTAGGNTVSNVTVSAPDAAGVVTVDGNDPATWLQSATGFNNARIAILYQDTGNPATSPLIAYADFGADQGNVSGDLTLQFDANGIFTSPR